ncbi:MAG: hypothetical protein B6D41_05380 [Chloroflexi bacterium UTCFX4]|jgi:hypothetical protein|nr:MAG: hypothetical protein B6D41_05380 [Chloroflexi bacterium UTCFX4]
MEFNVSTRRSKNETETNHRQTVLFLVDCGLAVEFNSMPPRDYFFEKEKPVLVKRCSGDENEFISFGCACALVISTEAAANCGDRDTALDAIVLSLPISAVIANNERLP